MPRPLHLICGMMTGKDATAFFSHFKGLAQWAAMIPVEGKDRAFGADELTEFAVGSGLDAHAEEGLIQALEASRARADGPVRILICGSLFLAGQVLELLEKKNPN